MKKLFRLGSLVTAFLMVFAVAAPVAQAFSAPDNTVRNLTQSLDYVTVQAAVTAANPGDTIEVGLGTYAEDVTITKALTLNCARMDVDARTRTGAEAIIRSMSFGVSNVTVNGCSFNSSGIQLGITSASGILSGIVIKNNIFSGYSDQAIRPVDAGNMLVQNNKFTAPSADAEAIQFMSTVTNGCTGTQVLNNLFSGATNNGSADMNFSCTTGLSTNVTVSGNTSTGNSGGSSLTAFSGVTGSITISNNTATTTGSQVFFFGGVTGTVNITGNNFTNGSGSAIAIFGLDAPSSGTFNITSNTLTGNARGIRVANTGLSGGQVIARSNNLSGNTTAAVTNEDTESIDASGNWWGSATQATIATMLTGTGTTNFTPWFTDSSLTTLSTLTSAPEITVTTGQAELPVGGTPLVFAANVVLDVESATQATTTVTVGGLSVSTSQTIGGQSVVVGEKVTLTSTNAEPIVIESSAVTNVSVEIPNNTTIYADVDWDGIIQPPRTVTVAGGEAAPAGFSFGNTVLKVGSDDFTLIFDEAVTLLLEGVTGPVGYKAPGGAWQLISTCGGTYASPVLPVFPGECAISDGTNTKILTFHFTEFASLSTVASGSSAATPQNTAVPPRRAAASSSNTTTEQAVAAEQAATSSTSDTNDEVPGLEDNVAKAGTTASEWQWWHWVLVGLTLAAVIYYLAEDKVRETLNR